MTPAQRARRIHQLYAERQRIAVRDREITTELHPLENAESEALGFRCFLRGGRLIDAMNRAGDRVLEHAGSYTVPGQAKVLAMRRGRG